VDTQRATEIQAVLEGIPLPATRSSLIEYARSQDATVADDLARLPDGAYDRLDLVGDRLLGRAPVPEALVRRPRAESGEPPGGPDYVEPAPHDTGAVRDDAPPDNPPQKTLETQSKAQKRQQKIQQGA
jgi:hypothetical protein